MVFIEVYIFVYIFFQSQCVLPLYKGDDEEQGQKAKDASAPRTLPSSNWWQTQKKKKTLILHSYHIRFYKQLRFYG